MGERHKRRDSFAHSRQEHVASETRDGVDVKSGLVSVIMAVYNTADYVAEAIDSVLAQDYRPLELMVIDDGSTDATPEILQRYADRPEVLLLHQDNAGQKVARNKGLRHATGEYVCFCDSDNAWLPGRTTRQVALMEDDPEVIVAYGDVQFIDDAGNDLPTPVVRRHSGRISGKLLANNFVTFNTVIARREAIDRIGGFDETVTMGDDYDLLLRLSALGPFRHVAETLARYRIRPGQLSQRTGERMRNSLRTMQRFIDRYPEAVTATDIKRAYAYTYTTLGAWQAKMGRKDEAWQTYMKAATYWPFDYRLFKLTVRLLLLGR